MRLGGAIFGEYKNAFQWASLVESHGYKAAFCPIENTASNGEVAQYKNAANDFDIVIGEVGAWSNTMHPDFKARRNAVLYTKKQLELADKLSAKCCVNIAGTYNNMCWYGPHKDNFTQKAFEEIVTTVQDIIDDVEPSTTFYTLEPSPWLYPHTIEMYAKLIKAIDRKAFAVHLDPVNLMYTPENYYKNGEFLCECVKYFGSQIKSCHIKDVYMDETFTLKVEEKIPGEGVLNYESFIHAINCVDKDMPVFLEHLKTEQEYEIAKQHIKKFM